MTIVGPTFPAPGGNTTVSTGSPPTTGVRTNTYSGFDFSHYEHVWWGPVIGAAMDGSINSPSETLSFAGLSVDNLTATWTGLTSVGGVFYSGPVFTKFTAVINPGSGSAIWSTAAGAGISGPNEVVSISPSANSFSVSYALTASSSIGGSYVPFLQFFNQVNAGGGAVSSINGQFFADPITLAYGSYDTQSTTGQAKGRSNSSLGGGTTFQDAAVRAVTGTTALPSAIASAADWDTYAAALLAKGTDQSTTAITVDMAVNRFLFIGGGGDDHLVVTASSAAGGRAFGMDGADTIIGGNGDDFISGGAKADTLSGDNGNDRFVAAAGDLVAGETVNGGGDNDALELLGGSHSLVGVTLTSIEQIKLTDTAVTTVTLAIASQAILFTSSAGGDDTVIFNGDLTAPELAALATAGIEHVHTKSGVLDVTRNYVGGVLQEVITQDPTDAYPFLISTDTRDASGATTSIHTVFDNGVDETILFAGGIKTSTTKLDTLDAFDWFSQEFTYSPNGTTLASVLNTADNGDTTLTTYGATSNTSVFTDVSNTSPLASRSQTTGTDGKPISSTFTYDDGRVDTRTYTAGILTRFEEVDVNNVVPDYKTNVVEYDATGVETRQLLTRDNLDTYEILHSGGVLTQTTRGDGSHSAAYDRFTIDFAGGTYTKATTIYDNQLRTERTYSPQGAVTSYFQSDDADVFTYDRLAITYKADGSVATQVTTLDNGHKDVLNNVDGGTLVGGSFNDTLIGHLGMDTFAFGPGGGNDYVSNFQNGIDKLDLSAFGLPDFAAVKSHAIANGANGIYMTFANGEHLAVNGLSLANFDATDVKVV